MSDFDNRIKSAIDLETRIAVALEQIAEELATINARAEAHERLARGAPLLRQAA